MLTFELNDLLAVAEGYGSHDNPLESLWPKLVWGTRDRRPEDRYEELVLFMKHWRAFRFPGGVNSFGQIYPGWLAENKEILARLKGRSLYSLSAENGLYSVLCLGTNAWEAGMRPTTFGKLLHFLLPETVLLWDQKVVRDQYELDGDPCSFLAYQCFGLKLLRHISRKDGVNSLRALEETHAKSIGYFEPLTRILDHLAYDEPMADRAVSVLGGHARAFALELPAPK